MREQRTGSRERQQREGDRQRSAVQPKDLLPTWLNNYRRLSKAPLQMRAATKYGATSWLLATCGSSSSSSHIPARAAVAAFVHFDAAQLIFNAVG